jgi:CubicO group peptidase (beta-lactamase class C family)
MNIIINSRRNQVAAWLLSIMVIVGSVPAQDSPSLLATVSPQEWEAFVPCLISKAHIPGLSIAVIRDGEIVWTGAFGVKSVATGAPCDEETIFEAASLTKPLFAYLVLLYVADGKLNLDIPLINYLPEQVIVDSLLKHPLDQPGFRRDWFDRITARHILSHSSGMPHGDPVASAYPLFFEPGSRYRYSADGYYLLQLLLENMETMPLDKIAQRRVLDPLGMTHSCLVWRNEYEQAAANGHNMFGDPQSHRRWSRAHAGATMYTTATDYARFVCAVMNKIQLNTQETADMLTPQVEVNDHVSWSLGFGRQRDANGTAFWQWGDYGIYRNLIVAYEESRSGVVWLTNSYHGLSIADDLVAKCIGGTTYIGEYPGFKSYDSPFARFAYLVIDEGVEAALARIAEFRAEDSSRLNGLAINRMGYDLLNADRIKDAIAFFELNTQEHPESSNAWDSFAEGHMKAGRLDTAITFYRRSLQLDTTNLNAERCIEWINVALEARDHPAEVTGEYLSKLVGQYGPRRIRLQNDTLYYQREGSGNPELYLYPLKPDLFGLQGSLDWRFRFDLDGNGQAVAIEGRHVTGFVDRHAREE